MNSKHHRHWYISATAQHAEDLHQDEGHFDPQMPAELHIELVVAETSQFQVLADLQIEQTHAVELVVEQHRQHYQSLILLRRLFLRLFLLFLADLAGLLAKISGAVLLSGQNVQPICEKQHQSETAILHNQEDRQHEGHFLVADVKSVSFSQRVDGGDDGHFDEQIRQHEEEEEILLEFPQFLSGAHEQHGQQQYRHHSQ